MPISPIEKYKAAILTVIAILLLVLVIQTKHAIIDGGDVRATVQNTVGVRSTEPLDVHAEQPLDVNIADQADVIAVEIEK